MSPEEARERLDKLLAMAGLTADDLVKALEPELRRIVARETTPPRF